MILLLALERNSIFGQREPAYGMLACADLDSVA